MVSSFQQPSETAAEMYTCTLLIYWGNQGLKSSETATAISNIFVCTGYALIIIQNDALTAFSLVQLPYTEDN